MASSVVKRGEIWFIDALVWCNLGVGVSSMILFSLIALTGYDQSWEGHLALFSMLAPIYGFFTGIVLLYCLLNFVYVRYRSNATWVRSVVKLAVSFIIGIALASIGIWMSVATD